MGCVAGFKQDSCSGPYAKSGSKVCYFCSEYHDVSIPDGATYNTNCKCDDCVNEKVKHEASQANQPST